MAPTQLQQRARLERRLLDLAEERRRGDRIGQRAKGNAKRVRDDGQVDSVVNVSHASVLAFGQPVAGQALHVYLGVAHGYVSHGWPGDER